MNKEKEIEKELAKLNALFKDIPDNKKKLCEGLIQNAAFIKVTLMSLQEDINEHGATMELKTGNGYTSVKDNPSQKAYTGLIAKYPGIIKQLNEMLPEEKKGSKLKELMDD